MRAAASCDPPTLRPTRRLTWWPPPCESDGSDGSDSCGSESDRFARGSLYSLAAFGRRPISRFQNGTFGSDGSGSSGSSVATATGSCLREKDSSFFQNGVDAAFGSFGAFGALGVFGAFALPPISRFQDGTFG